MRNHAINELNLLANRLQEEGAFSSQLQYLINVSFKNYKFKELRQKLEIQAQENIFLKNEIGRLSALLNMYENQPLVETNDCSQRIKEVVKKEVIRDDSEIRRLEDLLEEKERMIRRLEIEVSENEKDIKKIKSSFHEEEEKVRVLKRKLSSFEDEIERYKRQLTYLKDDVKEKDNIIYELRNQLSKKIEVRTEKVHRIEPVDRTPIEINTQEFDTSPFEEAIKERDQVIADLRKKMVNIKTQRAPPVVETVEADHTECQAEIERLRKMKRGERRLLKDRKVGEDAELVETSETIHKPYEKIIYRDRPYEVEKIVKVTKIVEKPIIIEKIVEKEKKIKVPVQFEKLKKASKVIEKPFEKIVYRDRPYKVQKIVKVPQIIEKPIIKEKIVEVEKIVEKPIQVIKYVEIEKIVEKPIIVEKIVEKEITVEKPIVVQKIVEVEKKIDVPYEVEKLVEAEKTIIKPVEKVVYRDKPYEVEKIVEVEKVVEKPITIEKPFEKVIYRDKPYEVEKMVEVDKLVEKEKIYEVPYEITVEVPVEKIVYQDREVEVEKIVEKPVYKDREIEKIVEKPVYKDREIEKIVEKPVYIDREIEKVVYRDRPIETVKVIEREKEVDIDRLLDMYKRRYERCHKKLVQDVLYFYRLAKFFQRMSQCNKERVFVNQKLEVVDGTFEVWGYFRTELVLWLNRIFTASVQAARQRKM